MVHMSGDWTGQPGQERIGWILEGIRSGQVMDQPWETIVKDQEYTRLRGDCPGGDLGTAERRLVTG